MSNETTTTTTTTTLSTTMTSLASNLSNLTTTVLTTISTAVTSSSSLSSSLSTTTTTTTTTMTTSALNTTLSPNSSVIAELCSQNNYTGACRLADFIRVLAYLLLGASLIPQIVYSFQHRSRYISGISYMWIIIRVLGLTSIMVAHAFKWTFFFEFIATISTIIIFVQILYFADNLHRQQKIVLITTSLAVWLIGGGIFLLTRKYVNFLLMTGYILLSVHMLPQILLNSLLRTAKSLSKFSILFLAMSDTLLFASSYTIYERYSYLVTSYLAFSFFLFMYLQSLVYTDSHIHLISRSAHTVLAPSVEISTGLEPNTNSNSNQEPQMFSIDDLEPIDGTNIVYQPVTSNTGSRSMEEKTPRERLIWYATLASIAGIEIALTIMIVVRAWSPWIVLLPISIPFILGVFYLLRTKLNVFQDEFLRKIL